jgi:type I restriction enzyme S subunit
MSPERLLKYFDQIAEAPDAVPRLRQFILDLAVRGKLVEQDPADESASELLKRIGAERNRLTKAGELGKHHIQPLDEEQIVFTIPSGWSWTTLEQIGIINPQNDSEDNAEASFVPMRMIYTEYRKPSEHEIRPWGEIRKGFTHFADGDVGLAKITPCFENGKSTVFRNLTGGIGAGTTELHIIRPIFVVADYILIFLKSSHFIEAGIAKMTGTAGQKRVPKDYFAFSPFPLPPLSEQQRIVAKVNELMALCDELESAHAKRERRRDRLVAATLHGLNNGDDSSEPGAHPTFEENARFYLTHLSRLTARPDHIHQLRQTILNLAVRGKLVPQDPAEGTWKGSSRFSAGHGLFDLPASWSWNRLEELATQVTDGEHATPQRITEKQVPLVTAKNVRDGQMDYTHTDWVSYETATRAWQRCRPQVGDILLVCVGATTGRLCVIRDSKDMVLVRSVALIRPNDTISADFFAVVLRSPMCQTQIWEKVKVTAQPCLYINRINSLAIPLPPLVEQHRIVAKVDELMTMCDNLEARITTTAATRHQLIEATIHEALKKRSLPEVSYEN